MTEQQTITQPITWALRSGELTFPLEHFSKSWRFEKKLYICAGVSPERKALIR